MEKIALAALIVLGVLAGCKSQPRYPTQTVQTDAIPLTQVLNIQPHLLYKLHTVDIRQYFDRMDNPRSAEVLVTRTDLDDRSILAIRTIYRFQLHQKKWMLVDQTNQFRCARAANTTIFQEEFCR